MKQKKGVRLFGLTPKQKNALEKISSVRKGILNIAKMTRNELRLATSRRYTFL